MPDALNVLAREASPEQWREVFREEDGWKEIYKSLLFYRKTRFCIGVDKYAVYCSNAAHSLPAATLGDLLRIANELAATEFCGGWEEVER